MTDEDLIAQVQEIAPGSRAENFGPFWRVVLPCGTHAGTRADPVSLAHDLMAMEKRVHHAKPDDIDKSKLEAAVERLRAAADKISAGTSSRQPGDMFDVSALQDLIRENEPHAESQERFRLDYVQLTSRLVDPRVTPLSDEERRYQSRLQVALYAGRGGAVEII